MENIKKEDTGRHESGQIEAIWIRYKRNKLALVGIILLVLIILVALFADLIADYDIKVIGQSMGNRLKTPNKSNPFGTDQYGRDIMARIVHGTRISVLIGVITVAAALILGLFIGASAGYYGGWIDNVLMRIMDVLLALPQTLLAVAIVGALGQSMRNLVIAFVVAYTPWFARVIRSTVLTIKGQDFIEAAKCCGTTNSRIILRHILPNAMGPIIVQATLQVGAAIIAVASMSFVGLGIEPPTPEWGSMLAEGKEMMRYYPHLVIMPGLAIMISVMACNLIGDGIRDALDPRMKR